jgi:putative redox protein
MVTTASTAARYGATVTNGRVETRADAMKGSAGGSDGFRPHELLEAAVAACMNISAREIVDAIPAPRPSESSRSSARFTSVQRASIGVVVSEGHPPATYPFDRGNRPLPEMGGRGNCAGILAAAEEVAVEAHWSPYLVTYATPWHFHGPEEYQASLPRSGSRPVRAEMYP